ncbi:uncharacterized protein LOC130656312 [Hydractinia symbiolongicarpus]|uniref:uncharacterized protein LOC130656312 n=1 Tax=Hydractinia symbiolongicarpus TaxID=13093 RepID=UPI00254E50D9|nr:uncharacterized protein LOC130656312 [Hydractinia symbiolongicarpus]
MYKYWVLFICLYMCEVDSSFLGICSNYTNQAISGTRPWHMWGQLYSFCIQYESASRDQGASLDKSCSSTVCKNCVFACQQPLPFNETLCRKKCKSRACDTGCQFFWNVTNNNVNDPKNIPKVINTNVIISNKAISNISFEWEEVTSAASPTFSSVYLVTLFLKFKNNLFFPRKNVLGLTARSHILVGVREICSTYGFYGRFQNASYTLRVVPINFNGYLSNNSMEVTFTDMPRASAVRSLTARPIKLDKSDQLWWRINWLSPLDRESKYLIQELEIKGKIVKCDRDSFEKATAAPASTPETFSYKPLEADYPVNFNSFFKGDPLKGCTLEFKATTKYGSCLLGKSITHTVMYEGCHQLQQNPCPVAITTPTTTTPTTTTRPTDQPLLSKWIEITAMNRKCSNYTAVQCPPKLCRSCIQVEYDILVKWRKTVTVTPIEYFLLRWGKEKVLGFENEENKVIVERNKTSYLIEKYKTSTKDGDFGVHIFVKTNTSRTVNIPDIGYASIVLPGPDGKNETLNITIPVEQLESQMDKNKKTAISTVVPILLITVIVMLVFLVRRKTAKRKPSLMTKDNIELYMEQDEVKEMFDEWEIVPTHIMLTEKIGEGAFGTVFSATINADIFVKTNFAKMKGGATLLTQKDPEVAVKLLKDGSTEEEERDFREEMSLMKEIGYHKNIVNLIGCSTVNKPLVLVVEYMKEGDLLSYLRRKRTKASLSDSKYSEDDGWSLTAERVLSFAWQIAAGMEYLASKNLVHRDLAARNVLVGEDQIAKVADFGLTRAVSSDLIYMTSKSRKLPVKWMSVEAIFDQVFTTFSDVWAYGVVLFEVVTLGGTPYPAVNNRELLTMLKSGYRMEKPDNCADEIYNIMLHCWQENPLERPSFSELREHLEDIMCRSGNYLTFDINENNTYYNVSSYDEDEDDIEFDDEFMKKPIQVKKWEEIFKDKILSKNSPILFENGGRYTKRNTDSIEKASNPYVNSGFTDSVML